MPIKPVFLGALLSLVPIAGLEAEAQTAEQLACQLSGACETADEGSAQENTNPADPSQAEAAASPRARISATRGFSIQRKADKTSSTALTPTVKEKAAVAATKARAQTSAGKGSKAAAALDRPAIGRADLRVGFVSGSAQMTPSGQAETKKFIDALQLPMLQGMRFTIAGHTDAVGSREYNLELSRARAQAVVDYLVANGADRSRFDVQGYGFDRPVPGVPARSSQNRRVEVIRIK